MENHKTTDQGLLKKIWSSLKQQSRKITFMAVIMFVFGAIEVYYVIKDHQEKPDTGVNVNNDELLKDSVIHVISELERTINTEEIILNIDTIEHPEVTKIKKFNFLTLDLANKTKELYNTPNVTNYKDKEFEELLKIELSWDVIMKYNDNTYDEIIKIVEELDLYGKEHKIHNYIINQSLYKSFLDAEDNVSKQSDSLRNEAAQVFDQIKIISKETKDGFIKIISLQEQSCKNTLVYRRDLRMFTFLLSLSNNYNIEMKKYK